MDVGTVVLSRGREVRILLEEDGDRDRLVDLDRRRVKLDELADRTGLLPWRRFEAARRSQKADDRQRSSHASSYRAQCGGVAQPSS